MSLRALRDPSARRPRGRQFAFGESVFARDPAAAEHFVIGAGGQAQAAASCSLSYRPGHIVVETGPGGRYAEIARASGRLSRSKQRRLGEAIFSLQEGWRSPSRDRDLMFGHGDTNRRKIAPRSVCAAVTNTAR